MNKGIVYCLALTVAIILLFFLNLVIGSVNIPFADAFRILTGDGDVRPSWQYIILQSRLPQALTAILCGSALSTSGLMLAGLGVALVMLFLGGSISAGSVSFTGFVAVMVAAFIGAMSVMTLIFFFSTFVRNHVMLLIIGIMIGYIANSAISLLNYFATDEGVRSYMVWGLGSFGGVSMRMMPWFCLVSIAGLLGSLLLIKPLNALMLGDNYAENLGINIVRVRNWITTTFCGPVAFIGLAVPHMARLLLTTDNHRSLLPATMLMGAVIALLCNLICCLPGESGLIPLNAVTPLIGAPVIIYVIMRR